MIYRDLTSIINMPYMVDNFFYRRPCWRQLKTRFTHVLIDFFTQVVNYVSSIIEGYEDNLTIFHLSFYFSQMIPSKQTESLYE